MFLVGLAHALGVESTDQCSKLLAPIMMAEKWLLLFLREH